jgi:hypothetical protein
MAARRLNLTLDPPYAEKLAALAQQTHLQEGSLARSLLYSAIDSADASADNVVGLLDAIPGALTRARRGSVEIAEGRGIPLEEL